MAVIGIVLAGGKSSRMGQSKALLNYKGKPLLDHMIGLLEQLDLSDVYVSGDITDYNCIVDEHKYAGPARAIHNVLLKIGSYDGVLFIPVDMPFLQPELLRILLEVPQGACFDNYPLPLYITKNSIDINPADSVKELLQNADVLSVELPQDLESCMANTNTPEEWGKLLQS